jgi:hypothetical protein
MSSSTERKIHLHAHSPFPSRSSPTRNRHDLILHRPNVSQLPFIKEEWPCPILMLEYSCILPRQQPLQQRRRHRRSCGSSCPWTCIALSCTMLLIAAIQHNLVWWAQVKQQQQQQQGAHKFSDPIDWKITTIHQGAVVVGTHTHDVKTATRTVFLNGTNPTTTTTQLNTEQHYSPLPLRSSTSSAQNLSVTNVVDLRDDDDDGQNLFGGIRARPFHNEHDTLPCDDPNEVPGLLWSHPQLQKRHRTQTGLFYLKLLKTAR